MFSFVFVAGPHEINSKQQNKIFLKAENSCEFYVFTTTLLFTRKHINNDKQTQSPEGSSENQGSKLLGLI